ncbi:MAG: RNA-binding protein [Planctomycetes bacterium]|nr:RNA-binding protein [Planctomycetota bacterium]MDP6409770.1 CRTAC1 family protein [Planctomycetota bacterium]
MRSAPIQTVHLAALLACASCGGAESGAVWFEERAVNAGLVFHHHSGHEPERFLMPEIMGGGAALADVDGDGRLDVYLVQSGSPEAGSVTGGANRLFLNRSNSRGLRLSDAGPHSGAEDSGFGMGVATGDFDGDGDIDLYVTNYGPNVLLANEGEGRFRDLTQRAGVGHAGWGTSAAFVDYDRDGLLDLFVTNYLDWTVEGELICHDKLGRRDYCTPDNYESPAFDALYHNDGNGRFTDVSRASGVASKPGTGLGVACADFDGDGWIDIFVANDLMPDVLWRNLGDGTFTDVAVRSGCAVDEYGTSKAGMGVAVADIDDDGDPDLLVGNLNGQSDSFFVNSGGRFSDRTHIAGLGAASRPFTRFGLGWIDFDCDGRLDLFQANGRVNMQGSAWSGDPYAEPDLLLRGSEGPRFVPLPDAGLARHLIGSGRGAAFGDLDDDGGIDAVVVNRDGPVFLLHNVAERGQWVGFRLVDERGRDLPHATLSCTVGGRRITRTSRTASSYCSANDPRIVVGLGKDDLAEQIEVLWPDGDREGFGGRGHGVYHELRRGAGL